MKTKYYLIIGICYAALCIVSSCRIALTPVSETNESPWFSHIPDITFSETKYVRADATGNNDGTDWSNAWTKLPDSLERGTLYYIADGQYPDYTFDTPEVEDIYIGIKKATVIEHGTDTGWDSSFGDGQAHFSELSIANGYWLIDGSRRETKDSGHGFRISIPGDKGGYEQEHCITVRGQLASDRVDNIIVKYIEFTSEIEEYPEGWIDERGWERWAVKNGYEQTGGGAHIYIGYCYFHHMIGSMQRIRNINGLLIEHNYYRDNKNYHGGPHADAVQIWGKRDGIHFAENTIIRHNYFSDIEGTACINLAWGVENIRIYGNIFSYSNNSVQNSVSPGAVYAYKGYVGRLYVYNNTFANNPLGVMGIFIAESAELNRRVQYGYNNLWYNCTAANAVIINFSNRAHNYISKSELNWSYTPVESTIVRESEDPFVDSGRADFHLAFELPGKDLSGEDWWNPPFDDTRDMHGVLRGSDSAWDIGALEH